LCSLIHVLGFLFLGLHMIRKLIRFDITPLQNTYQNLMFALPQVKILIHSPRQNNITSCMNKPPTTLLFQCRDTKFIWATKKECNLLPR
jgi:hypothetical protein